MEYLIRDPFVGHISIEGETLQEALEWAYQDIPPLERPTYVWFRGEKIFVADGHCEPTQ